MHPDWSISYFEVHADPIITQNEDYRAAIRGADIILTQPIHEGYRGRQDLSTDWVKAEAKPGCIIVTIPAMHFEGHHPGFGGLGFGDLCNSALVAHLVAAGVPPETAIDILLSPDLFDADFVRGEIESSIAETVSRDSRDAIDIPMSPIAGYLHGPVQLFHIVNHPTRPLYAYVLSKVLERLSFNGAKVSAIGKDYQSNPHIPMLPAVARHCPPGEHLPTDWRSDPDLVVRIPNRPHMSQRQYFEAMIGQLAEHTPQAIQSAIRAHPRMVAFMRRLAKTDTMIPDISIWAAS